MRKYGRFAYLSLAGMGVVVGVFGLLLGVRAFTIWSVALFVAAIVLDQVSRPPRAATKKASVKPAAKAAGARATASAPPPATVHPEVSKPSVPEPEAPAAQTDTETNAAPTPPDLSALPEVVLDTEADAAADGEPPVPQRMPASVEPVDVAAALESAARAAGEVLAAHLWLEDESTGTLRLIAATGSLRPTGDPEPLAGTCLGRALATGVAAFCAESIHTPPEGERKVWRYAVPLSSGDARGVAAVDVVGDDPDRGVLTEAAAVLRSALTGSLALHVAREQTRASNALLEATRELSRLVDPDAVVDVLLRQAMAMASAQTGSVMLLGDDGRLAIATSLGLPEDVPLVTSMGEGEGIAGWVLATGQPVVVEDLECKGPRSRRHGIRSAVSVPIADDDGILGVLNVGNRTFRARFSNSHRDSLETLARMGAFALRTARALETSQELYFDTLKALAVALETKDPYSRGSTDRVVDLVCALAEEMGMSEKDRTAVRIAALLHDVGMSAAGDVVAVSDRPLSTVEWGMVKVHPVIAVDVLEQAPALREAIPIVYHHHERFDGDGYVVGLAAQTIPLGARVLAVADSFVAMTSDRPYRAAMTPDVALREMRKNAGAQFDPDVVTALESVIDEGIRRAVPE